MKISSINCKKCQAPLAILGNSTRSKNLICHYCGTVMDFKNNFKALYSFTQIQQNSRLAIGQIIDYHGIPFTIVAYISYASGDNYFFVYNVYSPTHGYAKLIDKDSELIFCQKTHHLPDKNLWMLKQNDNFISNKITFTIKSFEFCEIYYAAGNLLENTKQGKRSKHAFAYCKNTKQWFYSEHNRNAVDYYVGSEFIAGKN
jgi:DNA-directed RNA polymerase subunit M/transcription elongation factor TFIIS